jgi:diguanylate cyclase (GGDEF)-like protein
VILEIAVEATGAAGGAVADDGHEVARVGVSTGAQPLALAVGESTEGSEITLTLHPVGDGFSPQALEVAHRLVAQAAIAIQNARLQQIVRQQALTDDLTGLVNRRRFIEALDKEIARANRLGETPCVLMADLDDFKLVNDRFGHSAGDEALRLFANLLRAELRAIDVAARFGGEEFAILLPATDVGGAVTVAERIRDYLARHARVQENAGGPAVTVSIGVAAYGSGSGDELLKRADAALYRAKEAGKNRVVADDSG